MPLHKMETMTMDRYKVYSLDVWGGEEVGDWEINNWFNAGEMEIPEEAEGDEIVEIMIKEGYFTDLARGKVEIEDYADGWLYAIRIEDGYPLFNLELVRE